MTTLPLDDSAAAALALPQVGDRLASEQGHVEVYGRAALPSRFGEFVVFVLRSSFDPHEHVALVRGTVRDRDNVLARLHSECLTGDVLGSLRCDCRQQLEASLEQMGQADAGVLLYMRQEGRGIGLGNKIRAYALQERGFDTVDANQHLGFEDDTRDYAVAALFLRLLGVRGINLLTNNPRKIFALRGLGVTVTGRTPLVIPANPHNSAYLATKARRSGHMLPIP